MLWLLTLLLLFIVPEQENLTKVPPPSEEFQRRALHIRKLLGYREPDVGRTSRAEKRWWKRYDRRRDVRFRNWIDEWQQRLKARRPRYKPLWRPLSWLPASIQRKVLWLLIPAIIGAAGQTFYVSPSGNDSNAGTLASPWLTMGRAWTGAGTLDIIECRGGNYPAATFDTGTTTKTGVTIQNFTGETARFTYSTQVQFMWRVRQSNTVVRSNPAGGQLQLDYTGTYGNEILPGGNQVYAALWFDGGSGQVADAVVIQHSYGICISMNGTDQRASFCDVAHGGYGFQTNGATRPIIEDCRIHHQDRMMQNDTTVNGNDHGGEGINLTHGFTGAIVRRNLIYECWAAAPGAPNGAGSFDYGMDGGAISTYAGNPTSTTTIEDNRCWNNHGCLETGAELGTAGMTTWTNGNIVVQRNIWAGRRDYQAEGKNPGAGPTTPLILLRASPNWVIEHNTWDTDDGNTSSGGFRFVSGGTFGGTVTNITIRSNILRLNVNEHALNAGGLSAFPSGLIWDYNLVYRTNPAHTQNAVTVNGGATTYAYSSTGLTNFRAGTTFGDNDIWVQDPLLDRAGTPEFRTYEPDAASPAVGAAHDGTDMGAVQSTGGVVSTYASDDFNVAGAINTSVADVGGTWSATVPGGGSSLTSDGAKVVAVLNVAGTARGSLLTVSRTDVRVKFRFKSDKVAAGGSQTIHVMGRQLNANDGYGAQVVMQITGQVHANFVKVVSNVQTALTTATTTGLPNQVAGTEYWAMLELEGTGTTTLRMKVWRVADPEPTGYTFTTTDTTAALQVAGGVGFKLSAAAGTTNLPVTYNLDDFTATALAAQGGIKSGAATLTGTGTVTATAQMVRRASVSLSGTGTLFANGRTQAFEDASVSLTGIGSLIAQGDVLLGTAPPKRRGGRKPR